MIINTSIGGKSSLEDGSVTTPKLADGAVTYDKIDPYFLMQLIDGSMIYLDVTVNGAPAKAGIPISGVTTVGGGEVFTTGGQTIICFATTEETTVSTPEYLDMPSSTKTFSTPKVTIVHETFELTPPTAGEKVFESSQDFKFSPYATTMDVCCVGAGGSGAAGGIETPGGGGGGGGYVTNEFNLPINADIVFTAIVGQGGDAVTLTSSTSGSRGLDGGESSLISSDQTINVVALGGSGGKPSVYNSRYETTAYGSGGAGNGKGGDGGYTSPTGNPGTVRRFNEQTGTLYSGGGAGGSNTVKNGGAPYGGKGGTSSSYNGKSGTGPGGGGGACYAMIFQGSVVNVSGAGYRGEVVVRWRVEEDVE